MLCAPLERHIKYLISDNDFGSTLIIFTLKLQWRASNKLGLICYWWLLITDGNQADSKVPRQSMTSRCSWRRSIISTVSPKRIYRELLEAAQAVASQVLSFGRVLSTRWVGGIFRSVKAVWRSYCMEHWTDTLKMLQKTKQETAKRGRLKEAWHIVCKARSFCVTSDSCMMYCLNSQTCLSNSRPTQSHFWKQTSFQSAPSWVLASFEDSPGEKSDEALQAQATGRYGSVTQESNARLTPINAKQFFQNRLNNMKKRLSFEGDLLCDLSVLDSNTWPSRPGIRPGELQVTRLCRRFSPSEEQAVTGCDGMRDFTWAPRQRAWKSQTTHTMHACRPSHAALLNVKGVSDYIKSFWAKEVCQNTAGKSSLCHTGKENIDTEEAWVQTHLESFVDDRPYTPF